VTPVVEYSCLFPFGGLGAGARGFLEASVQLLGREARFRSLGGIDLDREACADFERLTGSPSLCADVSKLTVDELRAFAGDVAPDVVFLSPPCKGSSGLLSGKKARTPKYTALNNLALDWVRLMLATWATPPRLVLFENVPGITRRARAMLAEVRRLLRGAGYVLHAGFHDCGALGGLAQHRKRFLLVARLQSSVASLLYQPPAKRVRGCGEVLETLPMPGDPAAGPLHKLPRISWLNWIRLALIPAGGDWRNIPPAVALPCASPDRHRNHYVVESWDEPAGTVTGATRPGSGALCVADPRAHAGDDDPEAQREWTKSGRKKSGGRHWFKGKYSPQPWDAPARTVIGGASNGANFVADPRVDGTRFNNVFPVSPWTEPVGAVNGGTGPTSGAPSVADPRVPRAFHGVYGVTAWDAPSDVVTGRATASTGSFSVADPRVRSESYPHTYGVLPWDAPSHVVSGTTASPGQGPFSVADPRLGCAPRAGAYRVVRWDAPAGTITGALQVDNGPGAVADPRIPADWTDPPGEPAPVIVALDGTWHRPLTTLELAALQGLPTTLDGKPLTLAGKSVARWRERIGNAVPVGTAAAIARQMLLTLSYADAGTFVLSGDGSGDVWVRDEERPAAAECGGVS
jgi:site-specific DNA-cytosine methylase